MTLYVVCFIHAAIPTSLCVCIVFLENLSSVITEFLHVSLYFESGHLRAISSRRNNNDQMKQCA